MSRIRSVTARPAPQWQISSQHFAPLPICVKMFHSQYHLVATVVHTQSLGSQVCIYKTYILPNTGTLVGQKKTIWDSSECHISSVCHFGHACHSFDTLFYNKCTSPFPTRNKSVSNFVLPFPFAYISTTTYFSHAFTFSLGSLRRVTNETLN